MQLTVEQRFTARQTWDELPKSFRDHLLWNLGCSTLQHERLQERALFLLKVRVAPLGNDRLVELAWWLTELVDRARAEQQAFSF